MFFRLRYSSDAPARSIVVLKVHLLYFWRKHRTRKWKKQSYSTVDSAQAELIAQKFQLKVLIENAFIVNMIRYWQHFPYG